METILEMKHMEKAYHGHKAVNDISFKMHKGEILCLLGPNGAGKTTSIHMIAGILKQDGGEVLYRGEKRTKEFQRRIGFVPQDIALYEHLSAYENIRFFASLYGLKKDLLKERIEEALDLAGLSNRRNDAVKTFSGGMKRRLNIACSLAHHPEIVIMDEPTVGIDPQSRNYILETIRKLKQQGTSILYTTHYMEEVETIADEIVIMDHGEIIAKGTLDEIKASNQQLQNITIQVEDVTGYHEDDFYQIPGIKEVSLRGDTLWITSLQSVENLDHIISMVLKHHMKIKHLLCRQMDLETVFLQLTGRSLRD